MNIKELKYKTIDRYSQAILFDGDGVILETDNILANVSKTKHNVFNDTLFCGMDEFIAELDVGEELTFDCVETDFFGKSSHFDFILKRLPDNNRPNFGLIVYDFGLQYEKIFELQQERNLAHMQAQKVSREVQKLKSSKEALEKKYNEQQGNASASRILIKADNLLINLELSTILYFEAYGDYIKVHTQEKTHVTYNTMKNLEASLPKDQFYRVHRSYIVRLDKIKNIEQYSMEVEDNLLPIGKKFKPLLLEHMKCL